jgi:hypothetical protein
VGTARSLGKRMVRRRTVGPAFGEALIKGLATAPTASQAPSLADSLRVGEPLARVRPSEARAHQRAQRFDAVNTVRGRALASHRKALVTFGRRGLFVVIAKPRTKEKTMGWTAGHLDGPFSARAAIEFDLGDEFAARVLDTYRRGRVIYAAVRTRDGRDVFALVLLTERHDGVLFPKPVSEDMGPAEDECPKRILDQLTEPSNEYARLWRARCSARDQVRDRTPRAGR